MKNTDHKQPAKRLRNDDITIESTLDELAPMRAKPGSKEIFPMGAIESLADRIGVDTEDLVRIIDAGLLKSSAIEKSRDHGDLASFDGHDLDKIRRAIVVAGMGLLEPGEDEIDANFAVRVKHVLSLASRCRKAIEFSTGDRTKLSALVKASAQNLISFHARTGDQVLLQAGARKFGIDLETRKFVGDEAGVPLTGKVARDRFVKQIRDEDLNRRDANVLRSGLVGAAAGALVPGGKKLKIAARAAIGAGAAGAAVLGIRAATDRTRDVYGERSRGAKRVESAVPLAAGVAGLAIRKKIKGGKIFGMFSRVEKDILFDAYLEKTGRDLRVLPDAHTDADILNFAIGAILPGAMRVAGGFLRKAKPLARAAGTGAAYGATAGAVESVIDGDPNSGIFEGALKGAAVGGAVGGSIAGFRGARSGASDLARKFREWKAGQ